MDENTADLLLDLNRKFYQTFAIQFSSTRQRLQPGVVSILDEISTQASILDLGCGNGGLAKELSNRAHHGAYLGLDSNSDFILIAERKLPNETLFNFVERDVTVPGWEQDLPVNRFDIIFAFALLHHIPGSQLRFQFLQRVHDLLFPDGLFFHSEWQFLNSPRLQARIQPWEVINLKSHQVDEGDFLIDWRKGGRGLRYVHHFNLDELEMLAQDSGFTILDSFNSDGEGGKLGLYQKWKRV